MLSFSVDSSELFYLIFIFYFECLVRWQPECSPLYRVPPLKYIVKRTRLTLFGGLLFLAYSLDIV